MSEDKKKYRITPLGKAEKNLQFNIMTKTLISQHYKYSYKSREQGIIWYLNLTNLKTMLCLKKRENKPSW